MRIPAKLARRCARTVSILLLLSVLGYPIVGVGGSLAVVEGRNFAVAFRLIVLAYSAYAIVLGLTQLPTRTLKFLPPSIALFIVLYTIRLIADWFTGQFPDIGEAALYFYGTSVFPAIGICVMALYRDPRRDAPLFFVLGGLLCLVIVLKSLGDTSATDLAQEAQGRLSLARLNPISIGHVGVTTVLAAIAIYFEPGHARWLKALIVPVVAAAIMCLISSGSRGPLVSLLAGVIAVLVLQGRWRLLFILGIASVAWAIHITNLQGGFVERIMAVGSDQSSSIRLQIQGLALDEFLASPITGSAYVETLLGYYPHNLILESAMALGIPGLAVMLWMTIRSGIVAIRRTYEGELMLPLLVIQYLVAVQFSGAAPTSAEFWTCVGLLLADTARRRARAQLPLPASPGP